MNTRTKKRDALSAIAEHNASLQAKVVECGLVNISLRGMLDEARSAARTLSGFMLLSGPASALPGVYFLLDADGDVVYVGQSKNVALRLAGHAEKQFTHVRMLHIPDVVQREEFERRMIGLLTPSYNVANAGPRIPREEVATP